MKKKKKQYKGVYIKDTRLSKKYVNQLIKLSLGKTKKKNYEKRKVL